MVNVKEEVEHQQGNQEYWVHVNWNLSDNDVPPVCEESNNKHLNMHGLKEVVQTSAMEWVRATQIQDIAFVFHLSLITEDVTYHHCFGTSNAFYHHYH